MNIGRSTALAAMIGVGVCGLSRLAWTEEVSPQLLVGPTTNPANTANSAPPSVHPSSDQAGSADAATPATQPSAAAAVLLDSLSSRYSALHSLRVAGAMTGRFDVDGRTSNPTVKITGSFLSPNRWMHESESDVQLGATGKNLYLYTPAANQFVLDDAPAGRITDTDSASLVVQVLNEQNPSLAMAVSEKPAVVLTQDAVSIDRGPDAVIDGQTCPTLRIAQSGSDVTVTIDSKSQLVRRVDIDMTRGFLHQGARTVKSAILSINYTTIEPDATLEPDKFDWTPPSGARQSHPANDAMGLVGKPPPPFRLKGLDGATVSSASLRGKVAVLNFFATWCGPCVGELPDLDKMYHEFHPNGLAWYEIDEAETPQQVQSFMAAKNLTLPTLVDDGSAVGATYGVLGIPQTVIIGSDGRIRKVIIGADPDSIRREIQAAMAAAR
jgi:peroxiredoxin/outer membrane lipoprotein-sorting protein